MQIEISAFLKAQDYSPE